MKYISGEPNFKLSHTAVTLGKFDGIHLGHQILLNQILEQKRKGYCSVMFTFNLHPGNLFSEKEIHLINTETEKIRFLKQTDLDYLVAYPFTSETASMAAECFVKNILVGCLDAQVIVVGKDYHFGYKRQGNVELLKQMAEKYHFEVKVYHKVKIDGCTVSSTEIRRLIEGGKMEDAKKFLGRPYSIYGEILHGRKLGRQLGMPTINMIPAEEKLLPPNGVYASQTWIDGVCYDGVTNIGYKPSVGAELKRGVETHLFQFKEMIYGKMAEVCLFHYERPEQTFKTLEELKEQIQEDIHYTKKFFCQERAKGGLS